ncbi:MAG: V-type ATP synthase subunit D [Clostridia bacterium]|nr:V-type ATP synthase subunit D [Clostridia bacterium]MBQ3870571.1 V-type ATP synthase subunit D [Clostridia bacterium]
MAKQINPTRMELTRLKRRLKTASRGHKLLKDKQNGMTKQFMEQIRRNRSLREQVEAALSAASGKFRAASSSMGEPELYEALMLPAGEVGITGDVNNVMSVQTPKLISDGGLSGTLPYSFAGTSPELDSAVLSMIKLFPLLCELAECEKTCDMLAAEIEKTRRRVNALEHVMIPDMQRNIKFITMKLEDNERQNITRLMKVKSVINDR